jgi:hypothetical protein
MSNGKHISNFAGNKKQWPVYMTFGNLSSKLCQMPSTHSVLMVALLAIPINNRSIPHKRLDDQWHTNRTVLTVLGLLGHLKNVFSQLNYFIALVSFTLILKIFIVANFFELFH